MNDELKAPVPADASAETLRYAALESRLNEMAAQLAEVGSRPGTAPAVAAGSADGTRRSSDEAFDVDTLDRAAGKITLRDGDVYAEADDAKTAMGTDTLEVSLSNGENVIYVRLEIGEGDIPTLDAYLECGTSLPSDDASNKHKALWTCEYVSDVPKRIKKLKRLHFGDVYFRLVDEVPEVPEVPEAGDTAEDVTPDVDSAGGDDDTWSRSDHTHKLLMAESSDLPQAPGAAAVGTSLKPARADHVHPAQDIPEGVDPGDETPQTVDAGEGSAGDDAEYSRQDHAHQVATSADAPLGPTSGGAAGTADTLARSDHQHPPQDVHAQKHGIDSTDDHDGVDGATENNIVAFNANGLPKDSGYAPGDFAADDHSHAQLHDRQHGIDSTDDHNGVDGATENNIMVFDANGLPKDGGAAIDDLAESGHTHDQLHDRKHDLDGTDDHNGITGTEDNFMALNASGLPKDSGSKASDFATAGHSHDQLHDRAHSLTSADDHSDVDAGSVSDGQVLAWNAGDAKWKPATPGAGVSEVKWQSDEGTLLDCRPETHPGYYWHADRIEDGALVNVQECWSLEPVAGYCPYDSPVGETLSLIDTDGNVREFTVVGGVVVGAVSCTMQAIDATTGAATAIVIGADGKVTNNVQGMFRLSNATTGDSALVRIYGTNGARTFRA